MRAMSRQMSFTVNDQTLKIIEELKSQFDLPSNAAVVRRAIALARLAAQSADENHVLTIVDKDQQVQKVVLTG
jgi:hypothetical protein